MQKAKTIAVLKHNFTRCITSLTKLPAEQPDPILGLSKIIAKDPNPKKVNLTVGIYKDDNGVTPIFPSVVEAISLIKDKTLNYLPILGSSQYNTIVKEFLFKECIKVEDSKKFNNIITLQTFSGTGALSLSAKFLLNYTCGKIIVPNITWGNHKNIYTKSGFQDISTYAYYDKLNPKTVSIDNLLLDLEKFSKENNNNNTPKKPQCVLLHASCHNPTGLDPTKTQWDQIFHKVHSLGLIPIVDMAYQGLTTGDPKSDVEFLAEYINKYDWENGLYLCQSFAKNMGLYGERIGSLSVVLPNNGVTEDIRENIILNLEKIVRSQYSSPSIHGSKIVVEVLSNPDLKQKWFKDVMGMFNRIHDIRVKLSENLKSIPNFNNIVDTESQHGMFYFSNMSIDQITTLREEYSIYLTNDGRISLSGINDDNLQYVCDAFKKVLQEK